MIDLLRELETKTYEYCTGKKPKAEFPEGSDLVLPERPDIWDHGAQFVEKRGEQYIDANDNVIPEEKKPLS